MKITVTKKHIKLGKIKNPKSCPIALACNAKKRGWKVMDLYIQYFNEGNYNMYDLPIRAQKFIERFDDGLEVKPFSFIVKGLK